jgi:hypothetical protein
VLLVLLISWQVGAVETDSNRVTPVQYSCNDANLIKRMADRLLVYYYCLTTMDKLRMEKEANYVDEDTGLPRRCTNVMYNYKEEDFSERVYIVDEVKEFQDQLRAQYDERIRRNNSERIQRFFMEDILHWPDNRAEQESRVIELTHKALNMTGHGTKLPISEASQRALEQAERGVSIVELFLALSSLNSDLTNGCDTVNITNFEIVNGACSPIKSFTPKLVNVLTMNARDQLLEIKAGDGCWTFWQIYGKYFGSSQ